MLTERALGIEISEARDHLSVAAAGYIDGDFILVELAAYLTGTDRSRRCCGCVPNGRCARSRSTRGPRRRPR
jgi:hypothetical protein